jgi:hypothetical protein
MAGSRQRWHAEASTDRGRRPSFGDAAGPRLEKPRPMIDLLASAVTAIWTERRPDARFDQDV